MLTVGRLISATPKLQDSNIGKPLESRVLRSLKESWGCLTCEEVNVKAFLSDRGLRFVLIMRSIMF